VAQGLEEVALIFRRLLSSAGAVILAVSVACLPALADVQAEPAVEAVAQRSGGEPALLKIANRQIILMRASVSGTEPPERVEASTDRIHQLVDKGGPLRVTTRAVPGAIAVLIDGRTALRVWPDDIDRDAGETDIEVAAAAAANLQRALDEIREGQDARTLLPAVGVSLLATILLAGLFWLMLRCYRWLSRRAHAMVQRRFPKQLPDWAGQVVGEAAVAGLFTVPLKLVALLLGVLFTYEWAAFVLGRFPYTRPWGEALLGNLLRTLGRFGAAVFEAIPGLFFVALIFVMTRIVVRAVRAFFDGVQSGRIRVGLVDDTTARPTGRLLIAGIWLFALVAAYPYIPGSGSEAFKGIGVFVGLMLSLGASGIVNQAVSGLMLMYTRALRPGEFVQIGEYEGTVKSVGFVTTRIETLRREEINIPNAVIATSVTRNYSRLADAGGVWIATKVTIGYDTPWRQVHALLESAAERTEGVSKEQSPRVRQTALLDFYVEYTLLVCIADPSQRVVTLDKLHANIQDAFNEHGVQIMSPNYEADPAGPKVVPRDKWFQPPATR
jgi:small-conductance mechanosensitive channel